MFSLYDYTDRVTRQEDNTYRWKSKTDKEYERRMYKTTMIICIAIGIFSLIFGLFTAMMNNRMDMYWIVAACDGAFILIASFICFGLDRLPGGVIEIYHLTDTYIETGSGKTRAVFEFDRTRKVIV